MCCRTGGCCSTTSRFRVGEGPRPPWSGRTGRARPRCSGWSPATSTRRKARSSRQRRPRRDAPVHRHGPEPGHHAHGPRPAALRRTAAGAGSRGPAGCGRAGHDGARRRARPDALRGGAGRMGRRRRLRRRGAVGRLLRGRARHPATSSAAGATWARCPAASRSGWCSRRCCAAPTRCCCSTSPTTTWTSRASAGWSSSWPARRKTVLLVSHDRELLADLRAADRHRRGPAASGCTAAGSRPTPRPARDRIERLDELRRRWDEEHEKLKQLVRMLRQKAVLQRRHGLPATRPR